MKNSVTSVIFEVINSLVINSSATSMCSII